MEVHAFYNLAADGFDIYILDHQDGKRRVLQAGPDGMLVSRQLEPNEVPTPFLRVAKPYDAILRQLVQKLADIGIRPAPHAVEDANVVLRDSLTDARMVRDRLLTLVEKKAD